MVTQKEIGQPRPHNTSPASDFSRRRARQTGTENASYRPSQHLFLRAHMFDKETASSHANDLVKVLQPIVDEEKRKAVVLFVDNGAYWNKTSLKTLLATGRVWEKLCLYYMLLTSYAPGDSKYNPIEHAWASLGPPQTRVKKNKKQETKRFSTFAVYRLRHSETRKTLLDSRIMFLAKHVWNSQSIIYLKSHGCVHGLPNEMSLINFSTMFC